MLCDPKPAQISGRCGVPLARIPSSSSSVRKCVVIVGVMLVVEPCIGTEFTVSRLMILRYVAGFVASRFVRVLQTQPERSWPQ